MRCVFPADSSYPSEAKRTPGLEVMAAMLMKLILSATGCFLGFPRKICFSFFLLAFELFLYLLPGGSFVSSYRSLVRRCYSLARTSGHYSLSVCQPKPRTLQVTVSQASFGSQAMVKQPVLTLTCWEQPTGFQETFGHIVLVTLYPLDI